MATSVQLVTQQPSSFTSFISATRTSTSSTSTDTGSGFNPFNRGPVPPDAIRFFIIAAAILVAFTILFFLCCISYRVRQMRMRRIVVAAFEQGVFDREQVRRRIIQLRGDSTIVPVLKAKSTPLDFPGSFETQAKTEISDQTTDMNDVRRLKDIMPLTAETYKTVAEEGKIPDPTFTALPIERQLALLFQANGNREKRKAKKQARLEGEQTHDDSSLELQERPPQALNITILISMPNPKPGSEREERELVLGSVVRPLPLGEAKGPSDATTRTKGLES
ncbi:hypothetical protein FRC14_005260 [Serendipita sp. 396]|nr:hypothetical protein FRC14_005260 [Serendipita sp. 396]KAG8783454.1 hypothetical protein FRC15_005135 [Serendipita sp. 397]KAG8797493.1 hypothetical protein FRC16_008805 [Serendipita sp. 398]KAG8828664.1 hypothetical protein FRC19_000051 [Serendipita sp. 401]KAG8830041.1 hypothetical protein FRC18_008712 [Serendipita sp. 400]KAG8856701.1 hypothetical protein FRB91_000406 [Serendipita sp. 411]KAG8865987.1 hypothetical protein FRC20_009209 [Serendipita sp. 405]KAG9058885.1 hypothetical prot